MSRRPAGLPDPTRASKRANAFDGRFESRVEVKVAASMREGGTNFRFTVDILDLSVSGFRLETSCELSEGLRLFLSLPSIQPLECTIAWRKGRSCGARFISPLHPAVRDLVAARFPNLPLVD